MALTKNDLAKALAKENGHPVNQTIEVVETLLEIIKSKLASGASQQHSLRCLPAY